MRRALLPLLVVLLGVLGSACGGSGVGDPCTPARPEGDGGTEGKFSGQEVYIETTSLQCRTRVCLAYKWDEFAEPQLRSERTFCTCKCGGMGDPSTFCTCPPEFSCVTVFSTGAAGLQGSYCIRSSIAPDAGAVGDGG